MELTQGQQRLAFVIIVIGLAGLGAYLIEGHHSGGPPAASATPTVSASASTPTPAASTAAPTNVPPSTVPAATPLPSTGGAAIYQWLPFTADELTAAARTATTFAKDYATWDYHESPAAYGAKLATVVTAQQAALLEGQYATLGVAQVRTAQKQVSTGGGTIQSISTFGSGPTITFVVAITTKVTSTKPAKAQTTPWALTMIVQGGSWQVDNMQPAGVGDQGQGGS
jgi:hypothetical protein